MIYITSDTHFFHSNIIKYCNRPFKHHYQMDEVLEHRWNSVVSSDDTILHLGDFAFPKKGNVQALLKRLNGYKILVLGNHDSSKKKMLEMGFDEVHKEMEVKTFFGNIIIRHEPIPYPDMDNYSDFVLCLHGHVHDKFKVKRYQDKPYPVMLNVGVDVWDFKPINPLIELVRQSDIHGFSLDLN